MPESKSRLERINEQYKKEIGQIINYELKNPNATGMISVTRVKVTNDLKFAKVSVSIYNSKNVKECLDLIPLNRLQIETDAPYLSPEPLRGTRNNSINMKLTAQKIADLKCISLEELAKVTYENTLRMFEKIK